MGRGIIKSEKIKGGPQDQTFILEQTEGISKYVLVRVIMDNSFEGTEVKEVTGVKGVVGVRFTTNGNHNHFIKLKLSFITTRCLCSPRLM
jgi:hypothetical protein